MKFSITGKHTVEWPVTAYVPLDGGKKGILKFQGTFEILPQEELDAIPVGDESPDPKPYDLRVLDRVLQGWRDLPGEDGAHVPYSEENKAAVLRWPFMRLGLMDAYKTAVSGRKEKN